MGLRPTSLLSFIMARVDIKELATRYAHFGLYTTSAGGTEAVVVRRKMGEPTDYLHRKSRKVSRQRANLALASQHWSHLTPTQKAYYRNQMDYVEVLGSPSEDKLLKGRQLFISREIRELYVAQKQLTTPFEVCIILVDEAYNPLRGQMWLFWKPTEEAPWEWIEGDQLIKGNFLFKNVKPGQFVYHPYGECEGYYDPETTWLTQDELRQYHYHILLDRYYRLVLKEPWTVEYGVPPLEQVILEPWTHKPPFPNLELVLSEPWTGIPPPPMELVILEPWTGGLLPPEFELVLSEPWTGVLETWFESYLVEPETYTEAFYALNWKAQSFIPDLPQKVTMCKLKMKLGNVNLPCGMMVVGVRECDGTGRPTGNDLCLAYLNTEEMKGQTTAQYYTLFFDVGANLVQGKQYALVFRAPGGDGTHYVVAKKGQQNPGYPDGKALSSTNGGNTWAFDDTRWDFLFAEGGIPL